ncbi:MAG: dethiobiotin synthase [Chromatiaceae bacterium]|nr:dethiobiotin synthase [Chromatiaceae bacterium]
MNRGVFVTGTDTGCGKTHTSMALIHALRDQGLRVAGFKPVAAGADWHDGELRNDDASALLAASGLDLPYAAVNPYCFAPAIAPHLAAAEAQVTISFGSILAAFEKVRAASDFVVVEGAGGWRVPLGPGFDIQGLALALGLPVILVVGLRLGCLNHALLSEQAIKASGAALLGWVGSQVEPGMPRLQENIATLEVELSAPCLGVLLHRDTAEAADGTWAIATGTVLGR